MKKQEEAQITNIRDERENSMTYLTYFKTHKRYNEQLNANKFENKDQVDKFLKSTIDQNFYRRNTGPITIN